MITLSVTSRKKKGKAFEESRDIKTYRSMEEARKQIRVIVREMNAAKRENRPPVTRIDAVSFDTEGERSMLIELGAFESVDF